MNLIPMWKIIKFILLIIFAIFAFNLAKTEEGEIMQFFIFLIAIGVGYYFIYALPEDEKKEDSEYDERD